MGGTVVSAEVGENFRIGHRLAQYALYASMSSRVMSHLEELAPRVGSTASTVFLDIRGMNGCIDFESFGRQLREHVRSGWELTIGVGMGPTKRWLKARNGHRKNGHGFGGVLATALHNRKKRTGFCHCSRWRVGVCGPRISRS